MKQKAFSIVFEGLSFGEKTNLMKIADTSFKVDLFYNTFIRYSHDK